MSLAPTLVTHRDLEGFLGGGQRGRRQRQRLQQGKVLPEPIWLPRVDRLRVAVYPAFALAGLVRGIADAPRALDRLHTLTTRLYGSAVRTDLVEALEAAVRATVTASGAQQWGFDSVVQRVAEHARPTLLEWDAVVREALEDLAAWGIVCSSELGHVERLSADACVVALPDGRTERFSPLRFVADLHVGSAVAVERVRVMGNGLDAVLPAIQTGETTQDEDAAELDWSAVSEADWAPVLQAAATGANSLSFDPGYWSDGEPDGASAGFQLPLDVPSGRVAAGRLLAERARA